jgi:3-hydroxyacyl-CoA dehydrogenase/3-hydroxy-2-methylbutyryl-CoA dehydrogenase
MPVVVFDRALEAGEALIASLGRGAAVGGDVNNDADVTAAIEAATERAPLGVVVNVAGGGTGGRTLSRDNTPMKIEDFRFTLELNTVGTFNVTRLAAAAMALNEPDEHGQRGSSSTPRRSPATKDRPARWPTEQPKPPFWG